VNLPLPVNDMVGPSVPMKCGANGKTAKANVCGPIFANFSCLISSSLLSRLNLKTGNKRMNHPFSAFPTAKMLFALEQKFSIDLS